MQLDTSDSPRITRRVLVVVSALLCLVGAGAATVGAQQARDDAAAVEDDADAIEIIEMRSAVRRALIDETNTMMLAVFGEATDADLDRVRADRLRIIDDVLDRLDHIAGGRGSSAAEATVLHQLLSNEDQLRDREVDPAVLFDTGWVASEAGLRSDDVATPEQQALTDLSRADATGALVLNDALDAAYVMLQPSVPDLLTAYVERSEPYIRSDPGYLGPDRDQPLIDSWVYTATAPQPDPAVTSISELITESRLWEYDRWMRSWPDVGPDEQPGRPPLTLAELTAEAADVDDAAQTIVDDRLAATRAAHERAAAAPRRTATALTGIAVLLACAGVTPVLFAAIRRLRTMRHYANGVTRDPLTGCGNRLQLDLVAATTARSNNDHCHLVIAVDLDRFKLVNDTWGHAVGDRVLVEVARLLGELVEQWKRAVPGADGSVIRMGGDEFLVTLHAPQQIDEVGVRRGLERIRTTSIMTTEQPVELSFSLGIATASGPCDLMELVRVADLAAYEEKSQRARPSARAAADGWSVRQPI